LDPQQKVSANVCFYSLCNIDEFFVVLPEISQQNMMSLKRILNDEGSPGANEERYGRNSTVQRSSIEEPSL
jgi:hypothetical protein